MHKEDNNDKLNVRSFIFLQTLSMLVDFCDFSILMGNLRRDKKLSTFRLYYVIVVLQEEYIRHLRIIFLPEKRENREIKINFLSKDIFLLFYFIFTNFSVFFQIKFKF